MLGNIWFNPEEKTSYRKIWDRVSTLELGNIESYIRGAYIAHLNLVTESDKSVAGLENRESDIHADYKPILDYIDELKARDINSTEKAIDLDRDLMCLRDMIAADMHNAYEWDVYGQSRYDEQKILDYFLDRPKMADRALVEYPRIIWASSWNKDKENQKYYKKAQKILENSF